MLSEKNLKNKQNLDCLQMGFLVHLGATITCFHAGSVTPVTTNGRVFVSGQPVVTATDTFPVIGCPFTLPPPHPCVNIRWLVPASRVLVGNTPVILQNSTGFCQSADQAPQGMPIVASTQVRVSGL